MKTGIIVYVAGNVPDQWEEDLRPAIAGADACADAYEFVTSAARGYDIHYAWWKLLTKGSRKVVCRTATFDTPDKLTFTGRELRLCG